jgi:hypothetical protein
MLKVNDIIGTSYGTILISHDAINWVIAPKFKDQQEMYSFASNGAGTVVCVGGSSFNEGPAVYTKDPALMKWEQGHVNLTIYLHDVVYSRKRKIFVAVGTVAFNPDYAGIIISEDGVTWHSVFNASKEHQGKLNGITYNEELDVFFAVGGGIYTSNNGKEWKRLPDTIYPSKLDTVHWLTSISLTPKRFVVVGNYNMIWVSTDQGKSWKQSGPK